MQATFDLPMAQSPDGTTLAFGSRQEFKIHNEDGEQAFQVHSGKITAVAADSAETKFASVGEDGRLVVWDADGKVQFLLQRPSRFSDVAFQPRKLATTPLWLAAANDNGTVYLLSLAPADVPATTP
jgi:WD40 repeat protein